MTDLPLRLASDEILEFDEHDDDDENIADEASMDYDIASFIDAIGTDEFKSTYQSLINSIENFTLIKHKKLCYEILGKIVEIYNYRFPENIDVYNKEDAFDVYDFIKFLEFDHINFLSDIWLSIDPNIKDYTSDDIIREVNNKAMFDPPCKLSKIYLLSVQLIIFFEAEIRKIKYVIHRDRY